MPPSRDDTTSAAGPANLAAAIARSGRRSLSDLSGLHIDILAWRRRVADVMVASTAQAAVQILALLTGLLVVRLLPIREYAYYTIANAILATMSVLSDSGIADSVIAQGGKVWNDPRALGGLIGAGLRLRRQFAVIAAAVTLPILFCLLLRQGAGIVTTVLISATLVPLYLSTLTGQLLQIVPRLHHQSLALQKIQVSASLVRFALVTGVSKLLPLAWITTLCAFAAQAWSNWRTRKLASGMADLQAAPPAEGWANCMRQVRRSAPSAVYYAFEGQIAVLLVSVFGKTASVASVGALTRLATVFTVIGSVFAILWVPRFAKLEYAPALRKAFWTAQGILALVSLVPLAVVAAFPTAVLWVLGPEYRSLGHQAFVAALGGSFGLLGGCTYWMSAARGVVISPWLMIPLAIGVQLVAVSTLPISTVSGVLWLGAFTNLAYWIMHAATFARSPR